LAIINKSVVYIKQKCGLYVKGSGKEGGQHSQMQKKHLIKSKIHSFDGKTPCKLEVEENFLNLIKSTTT
jgi:hypothetical protein